MQPARTIRRRPLAEPSSSLPAGLHPVLARVYAARHVSAEHELERSLEYLEPGHGLSGMDAAVSLLADAVRRDERILILADFDADGATSCAVAVLALRMMGAGDVHYLVPDRFEYGYGLTPEIAAVAATRAPRLLITVDNGISSIRGVEAAQATGMRVLVTDHHLPGDTLPAAEAIVNPNQPGDAFRSKSLAGVGVIFYVMLALRAHLRESGWFAERDLEVPNLASLLDLVALGTVADLVPLDHNNRILVEQGLRRIRAGHCRPGILALLELGRRNRNRITASDLGFAVGPRLNAAGRLEDMSVGIECLLADDPGAARALALRLDELNRERREIEAQMQDQAMAALESLALDDSAPDLPWGLCLYDARWHQGVVGLLASRIKERVHRPVIAFAPANRDTLKGSARSVPGLHIRDALDAVAARHPGLLSKFGGHAMAAGLSLEREHLPEFQAAFDEEVRRHLTAEDLQGTVLSDGELQAEELDLQFAETLRQAGPWGQGFPEPVFDGCFELVSRRVVGERHLKLALRVPGTRRIIDAIAFNASDDAWPPGTGRVRAAYRLDVNEYRGSLSPQLVIEHLDPL